MKHLLLLSAFTLLASIVQAKETCEVKLNDIGTVIGVGADPSEAFEDAATKCYDRHAQIHRSRFGRSLAEDDGLAIIDICANVRCS
jgi:hypothetical protein